MAPSRSPRIGATIKPGPPLGAGLAQLGRPPVVGAGAGEEVVRPTGGDGVEPGAERGAHLAGGGVGAREHDLAGHPVAVELGVALGRVPGPPHADLVEAVAFFVLAEPLRLESSSPVNGASRRRGGSSISAWRSASDVEVIAVLGVEVLPVDGRVRAGVTVRRDDHVVVHHLLLFRDAAGEGGVDGLVAEAAAHQGLEVRGADHLGPALDADALTGDP